jgi:hypothetical protein
MLNLMVVIPYPPTLKVGQLNLAFADLAKQIGQRRFPGAKCAMRTTHLS